MKMRKLTAALMTVVMALSLFISPVGSIGVRAEGTEETEETEETEDGNYGDETELPTGTVALPEGVIDYNGNGSQHRECRQIPNEKQKGIYFLNDNKLSFYSFATGELELVYTFKKWLYDSYVAGGKLYTLGSNAKEIDVYDLDAMEFERTITLDFAPATIGVDAQGRIYASNYASFNTSTSIYEESWIYLLTPEGELITKAAAPNKVNDFGGFDSVTGNFYFEFEYYYNSIYNNMGALGAGNVSGDSMEIYDGVIQTINGSYTMDKQRPMDLLGDKYLCVDSPYCLTGEELDIRDYWGSLIIRDSRETDVSAKSFPLLAALERDYSTNRQYIGYEMVGSRCVYNEENDSILTYIDNSTLSEYSMERKAFIGGYSTAHPVFSLDTYGDYIVVIERDTDGFYLEMIKWEHPDKLEIANGPSRMKAGETAQIEVESNGTMEHEYVWKTSDPTVVSITGKGKIFAWHEGTATITVSNEIGLSASLTITVENRTETGETYPGSLALTGALSSNISKNDYSGWNWSSIVNSYLVDNEDGTLTRVENMGTYVLIEKYDKKTGALKESKTISPELSKFGGFYSGAECNYLVFGQMNGDENGDGSDDETEVVRIVKYSKDWERLGAVSVKGANTYSPFTGGSLRMTETAGRLYIHTCHGMYKSNDGTNHQSNMTLVVNEDTMEIEDSYYRMANISVGYVSHSFNQFIQTDGNFVYRVDHGDAYPRAVTLTRCAVGDKIQNVSYTLPYEISGYPGFNYTGVSVGGFELSSDSCLIAGNSVKQDDSSSTQRNIFLTVTDKAFNNTKVRWITNYTDGSIEVRTPQLVKLGEDQFLLMWEERNTSSGSIVTRMVTLDGNGNRTSDINDFDMRLSDCQPVAGSDGLVRWYQSDGAKVTLYTVDPLALSASPRVNIKGDVNGDGMVTPDDALSIFDCVAAGASDLDDESIILLDMNEDGMVTPDDALWVFDLVASGAEAYQAAEPE